MQKKVSLKDIAEKVGVSTALVSYVLNNQKVGRISKEVAQKIRETAALLSYRPNQLARGLKTSKTYTIGLIVADIANPFFSALARVIEDAADASNYTVIYGSSEEKATRSKRLVEVLLDRQVDGIIMAPTENDEPQLYLLQQSNVPAVLIDRYFPGINASYIAVDNYEAAFNGTAHLISNGCTRIGMIGFNTTLANLQDRRRGYCAALEQHGFTASTELIREVALDAGREETTAAIKELLSLPQPVDALFFASNMLSIAGLKYINTLSIRVPDDLAILSFDESDVTELFYAPLTHIRQPLQEIGQKAVQLLLKNMGNGQACEQVHLKTELVVGKSTARNK